MTVNKVNPDSSMLQQLEGQWEKIAAFLVHKLAPNGVTITDEDIDAFVKDGKFLLVMGLGDSIQFKLVTPKEAAKLAEHDRKMRGHA